MIIEIQGQQVEVDDSFAKLSPEKQQEELQQITKSISPSKASVEVRGATAEDLINPLYGTIGGAIAGEVAGPMVNKGMAALENSNAAKAAFTPGGSGGASPGQKWSAKTGFGFGPGQTVEEVSSAYKAQSKPIGSGKISGSIPRNSPMNVGAMQELEAAQKAEAARRAAALQQAAPMGEKMLAKLPAPMQTVGKFLGGASQAGVAPWLGRGLAGASFGTQGADIYNRLQQGDIPGALISGAGTIGSGAAFFPHPITRYGGTALSFGALALNAYLDHLKRKAEQEPQPQQAQPDQQQPAPQAMAMGGQVGGLNATYNVPLAGGSSLSIGGQQLANPMLPQGGLAAIR